MLLRLRRPTSLVRWSRRSRTASAWTRSSRTLKNSSGIAEPLRHHLENYSCHAVATTLHTATFLAPRWRPPTLVSLLLHPVLLRHGEARSEGGGSPRSHPAVGAWLDDRQGHRGAILSIHQPKSSKKRTCGSKYQYQVEGHYIHCTTLSFFIYLFLSRFCRG